MFDIAPTSEKSLTYEEAVIYCAFCRHNGYSDWRMPTKQEYEKISKLYGWMVIYWDDVIDILLRVTPVRDI